MSKPPCGCGHPTAQWQDQNGRREYVCDKCKQQTQENSMILGELRLKVQKDEFIYIQGSATGTTNLNIGIFSFEGLDKDQIRRLRYECDEALKRIEKNNPTEDDDDGIVSKSISG